jgi:hypothetical protein
MRSNGVAFQLFAASPFALSTAQQLILAAGAYQQDTMMTTTVDRRNDHREGVLAKTIEEQTAKLPSDTFLWAAAGSIAGSLTLKLLGRHKDALFVGQWAPTFLLLGVYNKLVKQLGSDRSENRL